MKYKKKRFSLYDQKRITLIVQETKRKYEEEKKKNRYKQSNMEWKEKEVGILVHKNWVYLTNSERSFYWSKR